MIKRLVVLALYGYRRLVSPFLPPRCRFDPTCSRYAIHAIEHYGLRRGGWLALKRLFRCHPFGDELGKNWGYDPVLTDSPKEIQAKQVQTVPSPSYMRSS
jgi:putative membrane protein insertion efficiency factor